MEITNYCFIIKYKNLEKVSGTTDIIIEDNYRSLFPIIKNSRK
jgi:hypothetical protein